MKYIMREKTSSVCPNELKGIVAEAFLQFAFLSFDLRAN
jgi:hypothetical protein